MARKTKEDTLKTVVKILDAAEVVLVDKGVANTTISLIAEKAGVSKGAVYGHYKDKVDICVAVCMRGLETTREITSISPGETYLETLYRWGMNYLRTVGESASVKNVLEILYMKCEKSSEYQSIQDVRILWERRAFRSTQQLIRKAASAGEIPANTEVDLCNIYLHSLIEGIMGTLWWTERLPETDRWAQVERMIRAGIKTIQDSDHFTK
ncbi:TetR family transcriptional regulator [Luteolibacter yonseiensis]|uniref:TetR family transcriptional regulator n=1 Tax=Luteolibacter yonseiensis TaxID=1144680 RepID=A0A934R7D0_9BACT|nr:TetR family transcriptional regulator [Luteolibacter yonseiensis]MBK1817546.1 TetR family transcriptional regulator [Luteolibacter yonseiensis]